MTYLTVKLTKKLIKKASLATAICLYSVFTGFAVMGADTEIFFRDPPPNAPKPNILFIMSTGGTMNGQVAAPDGCLDTTKIGAVKCILTDLAYREDRINFGLMRFNGPGGPVLYPITNLDATADPTPISAEVNVGDDDVVQRNTAPVAHVTSNETMIIGTPGTTNAFRFSSVNIPQGATVTSANVSFRLPDTIATEESDIGFWNIYVEDTTTATTGTTDSSSAEFDIAGGEDLTTRPRLTAVRWEMSTPFNADNQGTRVASPDLTTQINTIINDTNWCGTNAISLFIEPDIGSSGSRTIQTKDSIDVGSDYSPQLNIEWDDASIGAGEGCFGQTIGATLADADADAEDVDKRGTAELGTNETNLDFALSTGNGAAGYETLAIGMLFESLNIPQNAEIIEAYVEVEAKETDANAFDMDIAAIETPGYTAWADGFSNLTNLTSAINWTQTDNPGTWEANEIYQTPDIGAVVQDVVSLGTWTVGSNLPLVIKPNSTLIDKRIKSTDSGSPARLFVTYKGEYTPALSTARAEVAAAIQDYKLVSNQPSAETYLEGFEYYTGGEVNFGGYRGSPTRTTNRVSHPNSYQNGNLSYASPGDAATCETNNEDNVCKNETITPATGSNPVTYISPLMAQCQTNHIVLLSDGSPSPLNPATSAATYASFSSITGETCSDNDGEDCSINLAEYLANNDINPSIDLDQIINTHAIHFGAINNSKEAFGKAVATAGDGQYYQAESGNELKAAFDTLISSLAKVNTSFVSAGITVNQSNRLTHRDELYFSLFRPESFASWPGNVKRYRIFGGEILDANDTGAILENADVFKDTAQSFWSDDEDGNDAGIGGAASQLDFTVTRRKTFSNITGDVDITPSGLNMVNRANTSHDWPLLLGVVDLNASNYIRAWIEGYNVSGADPTQMHNSIGDPLHSKPTIVTYRQNNDAGESIEFDMVLVGTNHGFLHAFYTEDGTEEWSFIPKEFLSNIRDYVANPERAPEAHEYGVDGSIAVYIDDLNGDGAIDVEDGDKAYMYVGLRRGGNSYYAFEITDHDNPRLMFKIDNTTSGFSELGQTWSKPVIGKLANSSGSMTDSDGTRYDLAMLFGAGYDTNQDSYGAPSVDSVGRTVYLVNAQTGDKIWDARSNAQQYTQAGSITLMNSVPADIKAIDPRTPGYIEHAYVSDTAGQIFRFDFDTGWDGSDANTLSQGGLLATIQDTADGTACNLEDCNRRFYYAPDISIVPRPNGRTFVSVALGSGYRAHPLDENVQDKFYGIRDIGVLNRETVTSGDDLVETGFSIFDNQDGSNGTGSGSEVITLANLVDITNYPTAVGGTTALSLVENDSSPKAGWILSLDEGEKVLAESITFNNRVIFTTYLPPADDYSDCAPAQGTGRAFAVNIVDGTPVVDFNNDGYTSGDRYVDLYNIGIPPEPQIIVLGTGPELLIGRQLATELIDVDWGEMDRIKWRERKSR